MDARWFQPATGTLFMMAMALPAIGQLHIQVPTNAAYSGNYNLAAPGSVPGFVGATSPGTALPMMVHPGAVIPGALHPNVVPGNPFLSMPTGNGLAVPAFGRSAGGAARQPSVAHSENFIVFASDPQWASQVAETAEKQRRELAVYWLDRELPAWSQRCPLHVQDAENLGASGETRFALSRGVPGNWMMSIQGTRQRILDSVLPHEITHTIFATHFGRLNKYVPRWADEGACTTVEHEAEKKKHRHFLHQFLKTGRGLAFNEMFRLKEYPQDILPLYAQGHSAVQFLLDQAGPQEFTQFLEMGMMTERWSNALQEFYLYDSIGDFQLSWNQWLRDGSPKDLANYAPLLRKKNSGEILLASGSVPPQKKELDRLHSSQHDLTTVEHASWFQRKLMETSGSPATTIPPHNHFSGEPAYGLRDSAAASRPQPAGAPGIQVLDWGDNGRVSVLPVGDRFNPSLR